MLLCLLLLKTSQLLCLLLLELHLLAKNFHSGRAKMGEHTFFLSFFIFFSSRTEKRIIVLSDVFWIPPDVFSAHFTPVATGRYVFRYGLLRPPLGHPRGDPGLAPDSTALRYRLRDPSLLPLRSLRKVVRDPKKSSRTNRFSVLSEEKKVSKNV